MELSPLAAIERAVQARAKDLALDMGTADGAAKLRALIDDEVTAWCDDYRRGRRPVDLPDPAVVAERAWRNLAGYGPLQPLLDDPDVWEIAVNAPDRIFVRRHHGPSGYHDEVFHDDDHVVRTLTKILDDAASTAHRKLDPTEGLQDAQLDNGARLHIVHRDISAGGHILVNIRTFTGTAINSLDELVALNTITGPAAAFMRTAVRAGLTVVFAGPPGAGKTTLLSCCAAELDPARRVVVAEEVFEADIPLPNVASMQTRPARSDRPAVDLRRLVCGFLRMNPDVAIVGECRDQEALPLLLTLSSGVQGFTTIHAGSARQALSRLRFVCQLADTNIPMAALNALVSEAVDIVVHCDRLNGTPLVTEIVAVEDGTGSADAPQFTVTDLFAAPAPGHPLAWTGNLPVRASRRFRDRGFDARAALVDGALAR